jgi:peptidyl-prolyl cis-trans isomerase NIMA-interacting 1
VIELGSMVLALWLACRLPPPEPLPEAPDLSDAPPLVAQPDEAVPTPIAGAMAAEAQAPEAAQPVGERVLARHILIAYEGAPSSSPKLRRSKAEAEALASKLRERALRGEDFAALAKEYSDDPASARDGGRLPPFGQGAMVKEFEAAAFALEDNALSAVVESPYGFHVIRREPLIERHLAHVVVQWTGTPGATATRTKEEARVRIEEAKARLAAGEPFAEVARAYSDGPNAIRGGDLGVIQKGQMAPQFDDVGFALQVGQISDVVESPFGFHILTRLP